MCIHQSFTLYLNIFGRTGLISTVNSSSVRLPTRARHVTVVDILPEAAADLKNPVSEVVKDVEVILQPGLLCAAWTDPSDAGGQDPLQVKTVTVF